MTEEAVYLIAMEHRDPEARDEGMCPSVHRDPRLEVRGSSEWKETARTPAGALRDLSAGMLSREHRPSVLTLLIEEKT